MRTGGQNLQEKDGALGYRLQMTAITQMGADGVVVGDGEQVVKRLRSTRE